ncbi:MAG: class F sortase [Dehalococcoidia bacterium]
MARRHGFRWSVAEAWQVNARAWRRNRRAILTGAVVAVALIMLTGMSYAPLLADSEAPQIPAIYPVALAVPSIGIDANVQYVGVADDGSMDIPSNFEDAAWYQPGYLPGQPGNAVFDGHVSSTAAEAVFFHVQDLKIGARISVTGADGTVLTFQVAEVEMYALDSAPVAKIFGSTGWPQVVLITCGGDWHPDLHLFDHRTVVYAPLASVSAGPAAASVTAP